MRESPGEGRPDEAKPVRLDDLQKLVEAARAVQSHSGGKEDQQSHGFFDLEK